jgi:N6-adenosine-specific RNA methylase IME4
MDYMRNIGYRYRDELIWGKITHLGNLVNSNGNIFRHSHESLLAFSKGNVDADLMLHKAKGMILEELVRSSQKPEEAIDEVMVALPNQHYL